MGNVLTIALHGRLAPRPATDRADVPGARAESLRPHMSDIMETNRNAVMVWTTSPDPGELGHGDSLPQRRSLRLGRHGRNRDDAGEERPRRDAQRRGDHGRRQRRPGEDRRGVRSSRRDGARARAADSSAADGGVARMSDPEVIREIQEAVSIPVMAKCRIGHFAEAPILEALEIDYIDESEVLTPADLAHHVDKWKFTVPFVCGATNLGEALRRIAEGAAMIRTKGEAGHRATSSTPSRTCAPASAHPPAALARRGRAVHRGEERPGAVRARALGRRERAAAGGRAPRRVASRLPRTRRSACNWAPTASSSGQASSAWATGSAARRRSSGDDDMEHAFADGEFPQGSASRWSASRRKRSIRRSCSRRAAGSSVRRNA